jgi:hypothetical protein
LAALSVLLLWLAGNHNVALCQGGLLPKKEIQTTIIRLRGFIWLSISHNSCIGDMSDEIPEELKLE